ncbi:IclR family transcriptional regulator [Eoetvoesiella caeni]
MSKFARMTDVLDLYSESNTLLTAEDIAERLDVSRPTAFRYARELSRAGFLANYSGRYSLGARIITLDYRIRESDPVLKTARDVMKALTAETGCDAVLCRMYNEEIINVHHEVGYHVTGISFGRGRPLPLFQGSASKVMLAYLPPARLKKIFDKYREAPELLALAPDWPSFKAYFAQIRRQGHYISEQELDKDTVGVAAPIAVPGIGAVAVISLVLSMERQALINVDGLAAIVKQRANEVAQKLHHLAAASGVSS